MKHIRIRHLHRPVDAEIPMDRTVDRDAPAGSCAAGVEEACTDELERPGGTEEALSGSVLEIGGAMAGLVPIDPGLRRRQDAPSSGTSRGSGE